MKRKHLHFEMIVDTYTRMLVLTHTWGMRTLSPHVQRVCNLSHDFIDDENNYQMSYSKFLSYTGTRTPNYKLQTFVSAGQQCKSCVATALSLCTPLSHRCVSNPRMTYTVRMIRGDQPLASPTIIVILEVMLKVLASNSQRVGQHASLRGYA